MHRLIALKGIKSLRRFYTNRKSRLYARRGPTKIYKSRRYRISFPVADLWKTARRSSRSPGFSSECARSFCIPFVTLSQWPRKEKERILERLVIKSKQKGIDVIEAGSDVSFPLFLSLSLPGGTRAFHEKLYPRKWQRSRQRLHYSAPGR